MARCPVKRSAETLRTKGLATDDNLGQWLADVEEELRQTIVRAKASPWPDAQTIFENVY
jgi:TPP-dependent pyruvate/acetoin dehydrogenase alpha subunit